MIKLKSIKNDVWPFMFLLSVLALIFTLTACEKGIEKTNIVVNDKVYNTVEQMPEFPEGDEAMLAFIGANLKYPETAKAKNIEGLVLIEFIVEKDGRLDNFKIIKDIGGGCGEETIRVAQLMPRWTPGMEAGKAVRVAYQLPVRLMLDSTDTKTCK